VNATLMGLTFMSLFISNNLIGWIGGFYERMSQAQFWTMHAAIATGGGLLVALFGRRLGRVAPTGMISARARTRLVDEYCIHLDAHRCYLSGSGIKVAKGRIYLYRSFCLLDERRI
jgi:hypothetical protein